MILLRALQASQAGWSVVLRLPVGSLFSCATSSPALPFKCHPKPEGLFVHENSHMMLFRKPEESPLERGYSRRHIARSAMGAAAAIPFFNEFAQAQQAERRAARGNRQGGPRQDFD